MARYEYGPHDSRRVPTGNRGDEFAPQGAGTQTHDAFTAFSKQVFADGALPEVTKQLIAVAHTTQCPYCIRGHTKLARQKGASDEQIMEATRRCQRASLEASRASR